MQIRVSKNKSLGIEEIADQFLETKAQLIQQAEEIVQEPAFITSLVGTGANRRVHKRWNPKVQRVYRSLFVSNLKGDVEEINADRNQSDIKSEANSKGHSID